MIKKNKNKYIFDGYKKNNKKENNKIKRKYSFGYIIGEYN
jgi:hypothetical protein